MIFFTVLLWWFTQVMLNASPESDRDEILRAIIQDVLTNAQLKATREFYGTPGDKKLALVSNSHYGIPWPTNFDAAVKGADVVFVQEDSERRDMSKPHVLGIRVDVFDLSRKINASNLLDLRANAPVQITILNAGGHGKQAVIGGCSVFYVPKKEGEKWIVRYEGFDDP